jgi:hypothetical protein
MPKPTEIQVNREYCTFNEKHPFLSFSLMRNGLFLILVITLLAASCHFFDDGHDIEGFITLKPGHFCQLGAIAINGDTVFVAGSYLADDDPNSEIKAVHSYLTAIKANGEVIWELNPNKPDYTRWTKVAIDNKGNIFVIGNTNSPLNKLVASLFNLNSSTGKVNDRIWVEDSLPHQMADVWITSLGQAAFLRTKELKGSGIPCINKQLELFDGSTIPHPDFCVNGSISCAKFVNDTLYFSAWGRPGTTDYLYFVNDKDSLKQLDNLDALHGSMVNDIASPYHNTYLLATTGKNGQGPCIHQLGDNDSIVKNICLNYWPMHGSTHIEMIGDCKLLAFNATDNINGNAVHLVIINSTNEIAYEETIASRVPFNLSDVAVSQSKIYLAGTLETDGKGSEIAIKIISLPPNTWCNFKN